MTLYQIQIKTATLAECPKIGTLKRKMSHVNHKHKSSFAKRQGNTTGSSVLAVAVRPKQKSFCHPPNAPFFSVCSGALPSHSPQCDSHPIAQSQVFATFKWVFNG